MPYKILLIFAIFLLVSAAGYGLTPSKYRYVTLLAVSAVSVVLMSGWGAVFLLITILTTYACGIFMDRIAAKHNTKGLEKEVRKQIKAKVKRQKKVLVGLYLAVNLGILLVLKYFNFFSATASKAVNLLGGQTVPLILKLAVPLGLSYYTLQALSYVIDVFRGKYKAEKNILKLGLFIGFFPQLHEGPFGRYDLLMPQMTRGENLNSTNAYNGIVKILWGLFKIFMVANRAAMISDAVFAGYLQYDGLTVILGAVAFTLQLYMEFSGYIDIARGISKIFGIDLAENFDTPFLAQNVADFWRRWHISLGAFFRDYVFYPVSTSKWLRKLTRRLRGGWADTASLSISLLAVWFLTGLWHGASAKYVFYGLYYFVLILSFNLVSPYVEKWMTAHGIAADSKAVMNFRIVKTWLYVLIGMLMFRAADMGVFLHMIGSLLRGGAAFDLLGVIELQDVIAMLVSTAVVVGSGILKVRCVDLQQRFNSLACYQKYLICFTLLCVVMIFGAYGLDYIAPDPIYGGF